MLLHKIYGMSLCKCTNSIRNAQFAMRNYSVDFLGMCAIISIEKELTEQRLAPKLLLFIKNNRAFGRGGYFFMFLIISDKTTNKSISSIYSDNLNTPFLTCNKKERANRNVYRFNVRTTPYLYYNTYVL